MLLNEIIQYMSLLGITIIFTIIALTMQEHRVLYKVLSGICWFTTAITQFILGDVTGALTIPLTMLFFSFGFLLILSSTLDWREQTRTSWRRRLSD